jgi:hypothetical protein
LELDLNINVRWPAVSEGLNSRLEDGDPVAFSALEHIIQATIAGACGLQFHEVKVEIVDAGPHNVCWKNEEV